MRIGPVDQPDKPLRPEPQRLPPARKRDDLTPAKQPADSLQISAAGRRLAERSRSRDEGTSGATTDAAARLSEAERQDKIDQVRQRIESGFYDDGEVKEEIARRLAEQTTKP